MHNFVNEYGNITNREYLAFEKHIGEQVESYLEALIKEGTAPGDVRIASHYLMAYLHVVESRVMLKHQMKVNRQRLVQMNDQDTIKAEDRLKKLGETLDEKIAELSLLPVWDILIKYGPNAKGEYAVPQDVFQANRSAFDKLDQAPQHRIRYDRERRRYIFWFPDGGEETPSQ